MPNVYCSVDCCDTKRGTGFTFFGCPKDEDRCLVWKKQLGFTGNHRYANLSAEKCYDTIKICSKHFTQDNFMNFSRQRLNFNAVPTLFLTRATTRAANADEEQIIKVKIASTQTNVCTEDVYVQTDTKFTRDRCLQTPKRLELKIPKDQIRTEIKILKTEVPEPPEFKVTLDDVKGFLDSNYSAESSAFLKTQLSLLNKVPKDSQYTDEFMQFALSIHFLGPEAYKKMATVCQLPSKSTLQRFTKLWVINPGFNDFIFGVTKLKARLLKDQAKDCILCIDEMSIKSHLYYDISKDKIFGFKEGSSAEIAGSALVLMCRGIATSWKQPVAYFFYKTSPTSDELKSILFEAIRRLNRTGLNVLAVVSDQGSNFYKLVKTNLKLSENNPSFFVDGKDIVYLFDVPHLLKSTRNNFFRYKFVFNNEEADKSYLEQMYNFDKEKRYRLAPRLTDDHIFPNNFRKISKVKLATQVFSHSVAVAMFTYIDFNVLPKEAKPTAEFIRKMNTFFDILNSSSLESFNAFMGTQSQISFFKEMDELFKNLAVVNSTGENVTKQLKFIFGWRLTIKSICILFEKLQSMGYKYVLTRNLNQDCLQNFFDQIRNGFENVKNPTSIQFCRAFKKIFALRYFHQTDGANCLEDINKILLTFPDILEQCNKTFSVSTKYNPISVSTNDYQNLEITPEGNALVNVTGYLLKKCLQKHSCDLCIEFNNSTEQYKKYSKTIFGYVLALDKIFENNFLQLASQQNVGNKIKKKCLSVSFNHPCKDFPIDYFVSLYTRLRIYFALKFTNQNIKTSKTNTKVNTKLFILQHL